MGIGSLEWDEIRQWAELFHSETYIEWVEHPRQSKRHKQIYSPLPIKQITLTEWELQQIKYLSEEYCSEYNQASEVGRPCPKPIFIDDVDDSAAKENAKLLGNTMRDLFGKGGKSAPNK